MRRVRIAAWWVFVTQILIVATGGIVRLTASGLGCPTWPRCTEDSFVATPEMGIHGYVEFGNRLLFFVLQIIAIVGVILVWKFRKQRRDLFWLFVVSALSVFIQAVIGGITVWTQLNPYVVGLHFFASVILVVVAALLVYRSYETPGSRKLVVSQTLRNVVFVASFMTLVTVLLGILTTGSGPHAGDHGAARNGLEIEIMQGIHAWASYITLFTTIYIVWRSHIERALRMFTFARLTLAVIIVQIVVGIAQARLALPPTLVVIHMALACILAAGMTMVLVSMWQRAAEPVTPALEREQRIDAHG